MRNLIYFILLFIQFTAFSQTVKPKCVDGNCRNKVGTYRYADSSIYTGEFTDKMRNGKGKIVHRDGSYYDGDWKEDKRNGFGKYVDINGNIYEGLWSNDLQNGKGKLVDKNKNVFEGNWSNGELNGEVSIQYADNSKYSGSYNKGREGEGTMVYSDNSEFTGSWHNDAINGFGEMVYPFGITYKGQWSNNKIKGKGELFNTADKKLLTSGTWDSRREKKGDLIHFCENGFQLVFFTDGRIYFGITKNNVFDGEGCLIQKNKEKYIGNFENGVYSGQGKYTSIDGSTYDGLWKNNKRHGYGELIALDGTKIVGYWQKDEYKGTDKPGFEVIDIPNEIYVQLKEIDDKPKRILIGNKKYYIVESEELDERELPKNKKFIICDEMFTKIVATNRDFDDFEISQNRVICKKNGKYVLLNENFEKLSNYYDFMERSAFERSANGYDVFHDAGYFETGFQYGEDENGETIFKRGLIDMNGVELLAPEYTSIFMVTEQLGFVSKISQSNKWAVFYDGSLVSDFVYQTYPDGCDECELDLEFRNGLLPVQKNGKVGFINSMGSEVITTQFNDVDEFVNGYCNVSDGNKLAIMDSTGKIMTPFTYDFIWPFNNGLFQVQKNNLIGFLNKKGETVIPPKFDSKYNNYIKWVDNYSAMVYFDNYSFRIIDKKGNYLTDYRRQYNFYFDDTETFEFQTYVSGTDSPYKFHKVSVSSTIEYQRGSIGNGITYGAISRGKPFCYPFFGLLDSKGEVVVAPKYVGLTQMGDFILADFPTDKYFNTLGIRYDKVKKGVLDSNGREIIPPLFDLIPTFQDKEELAFFEKSPYKYIEVELNNKKGVYNSSGRKILDCIFDKVVFYQNSPNILALKGSTLFFYNNNGKEISVIDSVDKSKYSPLVYNRDKDYFLMSRYLYNSIAIFTLNGLVFTNLDGRIIYRLDSNAVAFDGVHMLDIFNVVVCSNKQGQYILFNSQNGIVGKVYNKDYDIVYFSNRNIKLIGFYTDENGQNNFDIIDGMRGEVVYSANFSLSSDNRRNLNLIDYKSSTSGLKDLFKKDEQEIIVKESEVFYLDTDGNCKLLRVN